MNKLKVVCLKISFTIYVILFFSNLVFSQKSNYQLWVIDTNITYNNKTPIELNSTSNFIYFKKLNPLVYKNIHKQLNSKNDFSNKYPSCGTSNILILEIKKVDLLIVDTTFFCFNLNCGVVYSNSKIFKKEIKQIDLNDEGLLLPSLKKNKIKKLKKQLKKIFKKTNYYYILVGI